MNKTLFVVVMERKSICIFFSVHTYVSDDELVESDCRGRERTRCFSVGDEEVVVEEEEETCRTALQNEMNQYICK